MKKINLSIIIALFLLTSCKTSTNSKDFTSNFDESFYLEENIIFQTTNEKEFDDKIKSNLIDVTKTTYKKVEYFQEWPDYEALIPNRKIVDISEKDNYYYYEEYYFIGAIYEIKRNGDSYDLKANNNVVKKSIKEGNETILNNFYNVLSYRQYDLPLLGYNDNNSDKVQYILFKDNYFMTRAVSENYSSYWYYYPDGLLNEYTYSENGEVKVHEFANYY